MAAGEPISHELRTTWTPEEMVRYIVGQGERFDSFGYTIEQHTPTTAVLARRYTPTVAWALPLAVAAFMFVAMVASADTADTAATARGQVQATAVIFWIALIAAIVLGVVAKSTDRVTFTISADGGGSHLLVSGAATPKLREFIFSWGVPATATASEPSTPPRDPQ